MSKPTWEQGRIELARTVASHLGFTVKGNWIRDDQARPIALGWDDFAAKLEARRWIEVGKGIHWARFRETVKPFSRLTRTPEGYWV